jgi:hypothetical protein
MATREKKRGKASAEEALAKVFAHPLRVKVWYLINQSPTSPNRISLKLGEPLGNIAYHVRELEKYGCIELVDTKQRRGATEHYYRALARTLIDTETWARLPLEERRPTSRYGLQCIIADAIAADNAGTFDSRPDRHLTYFPVNVDEEGWAKIATACDDFLDLVMKTQEESANRAAESPDQPTISAVASLLFFERPPSAPQ